jgi:Spy/CpxP family protein refolding chaperone
MKMMLLILTCVLLGSGGLVMTVAADDDPPPPPPDDGMMFGHPDFGSMMFAQVGDSGKPMMGRRGRGPGRGEWKRQMKHLEQLRLLKMLELLDLEDQQEIPFLTAFNDMRDRHRDLDDRIDALLDSLAQGLRESNIDDVRINDLVDRGLTLEESKRGIMFEFIDEARNILTPTQLGKFVIFQKRFESHMLQQIGRFRQGMRPGGQGLLDGEG